MDKDSNISLFKNLLDEPTNAKLLACLMDGRALPISELAYMLKLPNPTVRSHLSRLVERNLIHSEQHGKHHYYRIANEDIASALSILGITSNTVQVQAPKQSNLQKQVKSARTCYGHLAGELGVKITASLLDKNVILQENEKFIVTKEGNKWFQQLGIDIEERKTKRRIFAKPCLDWSERRYHLSGWLGSALANHFFEQEWILKSSYNRAVHLTPKGIQALQDYFDIDIFK